MKIINYKNLAKPSNILRNFATEPATWYDIQAINDQACTEWDIYLRVNINSFGAVSKDIFGGSSTFPIRIIYIAGAQVQIGMTGYGQGITNYNYPGVWEFKLSCHNGVVNAQFKRPGLSAFATIVNYAATRPLYWSVAPSSNFDGSIEEFSIYNAGVVVWSYPSLSERLRLITYTNVIWVDDHWEAANPALTARIDTAIDLRGMVSSYTSIVDFEAATLVYHGDKQELTGQGSAYSGTAAICALAYLYSNSVYYLIASQEIGGARAYRLIALSGALTGRHRAALTITVGSTSTIFTIYLDGVMLSSQTATGIPTGIAGPTNTCFAINDHRAGVGRNFFGKFLAVELFNEALTAEEILYRSKHLLYT